jgi:hypothetical protein
MCNFPQILYYRLIEQHRFLWQFKCTVNILQLHFILIYTFYINSYLKGFIRRFNCFFLTIIQTKTIENKKFCRTTMNFIFVSSVSVWNIEKKTTKSAKKIPRRGIRVKCRLKWKLQLNIPKCLCSICFKFCIEFKSHTYQIIRVDCSSKNLIEIIFLTHFLIEIFFVYFAAINLTKRSKKSKNPKL